MELGMVGMSRFDGGSPNDSTYCPIGSVSFQAGQLTYTGI